MTHLRKLQVIQNQVTRIITHLPRVASREKFHDELNLPTVDEFFARLARNLYEAARASPNPLISGLGRAVSQVEDSHRISCLRYAEKSLATSDTTPLKMSAAVADETSVDAKCMVRNNFATQKINGVHHFLLTSATVHLDPKRMYIYLDNLFNGDKRLGDEMNKLLDENWKEVFDEITPHIAASFLEMFKGIFNGVENTGHEKDKEFIFYKCRQRLGAGGCSIHYYTTMRLILLAVTLCLAHAEVPKLLYGKAATITNALGGFSSTLNLDIFPDHLFSPAAPTDSLLTNAVPTDGPKGATQKSSSTTRNAKERMIQPSPTTAPAAQTSQTTPSPHVT
ncbi:hypothetical protein ANN_10248 [Periplaneta americana]|uniref:Uncharacterized protein n=1 Tax=Periplaneta americana TaxID=6978 RepID=A0ABQ8TRM8_PERAM|nr:hypothetical protein ANN_10248 [Periplaneta americana]